MSEKTEHASDDICPTCKEPLGVVDVPPPPVSTQEMDAELAATGELTILDMWGCVTDGCPMNPASAGLAGAVDSPANRERAQRMTQVAEEGKGPDGA